MNSLFDNPFSVRYTIPMRLDIHHHFDLATERMLQTLFTHFQERIMAVLDDLTANVTANTSAVQSAITLLGNLKAQLDAAIASGDPAKLQALSDALGKNDTDLAAAITANTPAA